MTPVNFAQANVVFGPPADLEESQCMRIPAHVGEVKGGSCDGCKQVITAWLPTEAELAVINEGKPIYLSFIGGLPPHYPSMSFEEASNPA